MAQQSSAGNTAQTQDQNAAGTILLLKTSESQPLQQIRNTASLVMAITVQRLFSKAQVTVGQCTENGYYYDLDNPEPLAEKELKTIKKEMIKVINKKMAIVLESVSREAAKKRCEALADSAYKLEILDGLKGDAITLVTVGDDWWDFAKGPFLENTSGLNPKAIALENVAGAYWLGDETKQQLQRISGTAWETKEQLDEYQRRKEEAMKRDHRRLGKELDLFMFSELVGPGLPLWTPKGTLLRSLLEDYLKQEQIKRGYLPVTTPHIAKVDLFKASGHWQQYREDMFPMMAEDEVAAAIEDGFVMKPMNCPFHIQIFKNQLRSYRELPIRMAEFGTVYRYEKSGQLGGLTRVRGFTVDDSHLFLRPDQLDEEFLQVVDLILQVFKDLQLKKFKARLSFKEEGSDKYIGSDEAWDKAQGAIRRAVDTLGMESFEGIGEAAFYGPKLDFIFQDALEREWQLGTVQVDYNLPERFELEYVAEDGSRQRPVMIHRAPFGSVERLVGILIEEYAGDFPFWMAPEQMRLLPVGADFMHFAQETAAKLRSHGIRAEVDQSGDRLGKLIRNGEKQKIPVMAVVGAKEVDTNSLSIRTRAEGELGAIDIATVIDRAVKANGDRANF